jgi:hypothetical protein
LTECDQNIQPQSIPVLSHWTSLSPQRHVRHQSISSQPCKNSSEKVNGQTETGDISKTIKRMRRSIHKSTQMSVQVLGSNLCARYSSFRSNISRTLLVDLYKSQEASNGALLKAQTAAVQKYFVPGTKLSSAYIAAVSSVKSSQFAERKCPGCWSRHQCRVWNGCRISRSCPSHQPQQRVARSRVYDLKVAAGSKRLKDAQYGPYPLFLEERCMFVGGISS